MKKKGLSQRQLARIHNRQQRLVDPGAQADSAASSPERRGLVLARLGDQLEVETLDGEDRGQVYRCFQRSNLATLVAGDEVAWQRLEAGSDGIVLAALPRRTVLQRPARGGELRTVAANIDTLVIVIAPEPEAHANLIDRYLVAAELAGLEPLLLLNKADLLTHATAARLQELLQLYQRIGYRSLQVSCRSGAGLAALRQLLSQGNNILVGQSGVGKSALVNALLPGVNTAEGALSSAAGKGRHTTTTARLYHLADGGNLIDSPGIREFGLDHVPQDAVLRGFRELQACTANCRFRDCRHEAEPGCGLQQALADGKIDPRRLASYRAIHAGLDQTDNG